MEVEMIKKAIEALFSSQKRISWRRLATLALGTGLLCVQMIDAQQWMYLALAYVAGDSAEKAIAALRG